MRAAKRERDKDVLDDLDITVGETEITIDESDLPLSDADFGEPPVAGWSDRTETNEHNRVTVAPPMPEHEYVAKMMKQLPDAERIPPSRAITPPRGLSKPPFVDTAPPVSGSRPSARPRNREGATSASMKPNAPSVKPRAPSMKPQTSVKPQTPSVKPQPPVKPRTASMKPPTSVKPQTPSVKPQTPSVKPRTRTSRSPGAAPPPAPAEPLTLDLSDSLLPIAVPSPVPLPAIEQPPVPKFDLEPEPELPPPSAGLPFPPPPKSDPAFPAPSSSQLKSTALPKLSQNSALDAVASSAPLRSTDPPRLSFSPAAGDPLELVGVHAQSVKPGADPKPTMVEVRDRFDVGDFSGALALATKILEDEPEHVDALLYAEHCRDVLKQMYISSLGGLRKVPQIAVSPEQLRWLALDHRAGFLLAQLDGRSSLEELLDVCGMPPFEAIRLLVQLLQQNVIRVV
jgi:hypothetical protein